LQAIALCGALVGTETSLSEIVSAVGCQLAVIGDIAGGAATAPGGYPCGPGSAH